MRGLFFVTSDINTDDLRCVAHLYDINTDEQIHFTQSSLGTQRNTISHVKAQRVDV